MSNLPALPDRPERAPADLAAGLPEADSVEFLFGAALGPTWRHRSLSLTVAREVAAQQIGDELGKDLEGRLGPRTLARLGALLALSHASCGWSVVHLARRSLAQALARGVALPSEGVSGRAFAEACEVVLRSVPGGEPSHQRALGWKTPAGGFVPVWEFLESSSARANVLAEPSPEFDFDLDQGGGDAWEGLGAPASWDDLVEGELPELVSALERLIAIEPKGAHEAPSLRAPVRTEPLPGTADFVVLRALRRAAGSHVSESDLGDELEAQGKRRSNVRPSIRSLKKRKGWGDWIDTADPSHLTGGWSYIGPTSALDVGP